MAANGHDVMPSAQCGTSSAIEDETASTVDPFRAHSSGKKAQPSALPPRERHARAAANTKRLSLIARAENKHSAKRNFRDDEEFGAYVAAQQKRIANAAATSQQQIAPSRKKSKKSGHQSLALNHHGLESRTDVACSPEHIVPVSAQQSLVDVYNSVSAADQNQARTDVAHERAGAKAKAKAPTGRKKLKAPDTSERPSKKQRQLDGTSNAISALNDAMVRQKESQAGRLAGLHSDIATADEPSTSANPRKRVLSHPGGAVLETGGQAAAPGAARVPRLLDLGGHDHQRGQQVGRPARPDARGQHLCGHAFHAR